MANYVLLERIELNDSVASVTFNNIPQTGYTDLKIVGSTRYSTAISMGGFGITFNGLNTNQSAKYLYGAGSGTPGSGSFLLFDSNGASDTANTFSNWEIYIPNYTSSNYKSFSIDDVLEANATYAEAIMNAGLWSSAAAITSIGFARSAATWGQYSTFSLYGLSAYGTTPAIAPKASGGSVIQTDGTYWYHAFLSSSTFTPSANLSCDILVVGGGAGGAGTYGGGGGGAGGIQYSASQSLTATNYSIVIGAGGAGGIAANTPTGDGYNGVNSTFNSSIIGYAGNKGIAYGSNTGGNSGAPTSYTGGTGYVLPSGYGEKGGGGAGSGANGVSPAQSAGGSGGNGGTGINTYSSWATATSTGVSGYFAGGGAGGGARDTTSGTGGAGGGGAGGPSLGTTGVAGITNTGSGGGGSRGNSTGGAGGSGIVIIRYAI